MKQDNKNIVYISHGGGPLPILGDPGHERMVAFMKQLPSHLMHPEVIIVISAHWEEEAVTTTSGEDPGLLYDYYGFPEEAYQLTYPAKGNPKVAQTIQEELIHHGITAAIDSLRQFDHGLFIPLKLMYKEANIPVLQISLEKSLDAQEHINIGKVLRDVDLLHALIIGSGFSFHNMREFRFDNVHIHDPKNDAFQDWLIDICTHEGYTQEEREKALANWEEAPHARYCHPREEHLLPLHVCVGIANKRGEKIFDDYILGKRAVAFKW